ncbi:alpha/beta hydrolase, partial [bacterium]
VMSALAVAAGAPSSFAQTYTQPLGIAQEGVAYPYPTRYLELNNGGQPVRMAYMDVPSRRAFAGEGKQVVLLLHGKNFSGFYWEKPIRALTNAGYRVIVPDQIGFGKSSKPGIPYSFDLLTTNTAKLLDSLKVGKVSVVGHSMGGMVAVKFARKYPQRVQKLVLENPIGLEDYKAAIGPVPFAKLLKTELNDTNTVKLRAFYKRYFVQWKPEFEKFVEIKSRIALSGEFNRWAKAAALTYAPIFDEPIVPDFPRLKVPTLLIIGQSDRTVVGKPYATPEVAKTLGNYPRLGRVTQKAIPGAKLVELPNVGHIPHLEVPEKFNVTLLQFLK